MPEGGITDGWAIATNSSRGKFSVADRKFVIRGLTQEQIEVLTDADLIWAGPAAFIVWALGKLRPANDDKEVTVADLKTLDNAEIAELYKRLQIQLGFSKAKDFETPDAPAET